MSDLLDRPTDLPPPPLRTRIKKRRVLVILLPLVVLAAISTVFGMMMAVASDLPALENEPQYKTAADARNTTLEDDQGRFIGRLVSDKNRIFVKYDDIATSMRQAIIAIEDERFNTNNGVDLRGIARAFTQDVIRKRAAQGGSTITQQFVKNALQAQSQRTVFEKLREAALAYHLTRRWGKHKILQEYLNSIYFGNGAYGIEAAARTYFGQEPWHAGCGTATRPCAAELRPHESAFLAGIVASPTGFDPVNHPVAATTRRNTVLAKMLKQGYLTRAHYESALLEALPGHPQPPQLDAPLNSEFFVSWIRQQLVDRYGAQRAFEGGLRVRTTLDLKLQQAAEDAVKRYVANIGPTASLVAIDNDTGEVRAMVSGTKDFSQAPFNLATQGQRQPGSSIKPFILAEALRQGISPESVWPSRKRVFCVVHTRKGCIESFPVNNFESTYVGQRTLANALTYSDNSVFAAVGIKVGTRKVARLAERMGIRTPVSHNLAMTLGGLKQGVTPLDMAHAYETFASGGRRITGSLGAPDDGPVGIARVTDKNGHVIRDGLNQTRRIPVLSRQQAQTATRVMTTVVTQGTGKRAAIGQFAAGKTGTTENSGDAWFVGFTSRLTVAVWVGYPDKLKPMETDFQGGPVEGGTFPALIWHDFQLGANAVLDARVNADRKRRGLPPLGPTGPTVVLPAQSTPTAAPVAPAGTTGQGGAAAAPGAATPGTAAGGAGPAAAGTPATPAPTPTPTPKPATPATPPSPDPTPGSPSAGGAGAPSG